MIAPKTEKSYRMCSAVIHLPDHGRLRTSMISLLENLITSIGITVQQVLENIKHTLVMDYDWEKKVSRARLHVSVSGDDISRAERLIAQPETHFGYTNAYRLVEMHREEEGKAVAIFEIARSKTFLTKAGQERRVLDAMPANFLAQVISSWCKYPELDALIPTLKGGVAQKVSEQILSYIQLKDEDPSTSFPSTGERSPEAKKTAWLGALDRVCGNKSGFEYKLARDLDPSIPEDDPRGNRRINVDPDWITFVELPDVDRFPGSFEKNDVVVYRRYTDEKAKAKMEEHYASNQGRLYSLIPVKEITDEKFLWWTKHKEEFTPLPAFGPRSWPKKPCHIMVPLEYRDNLDILSDPLRRVKKAILVEERDHRPGRHGHKGNNIPFIGKRWILKFSTESEVEVRLTENILGIHFHEEGKKLLVVWVLMKDGKELEKGEFEQTLILDHALIKKDYREGLQRSHRWVGGQQCHQELKRRTEELAHKIASLANDRNAQIVLEDIKHVQKQGQGHDMNSRHSLWNYASLSTKIEFFAKDRYGIPTERRNEFLMKFQCPHCGAVRKAGETKETATTWRDGNKLICRKCNTTTEQGKFYFANRLTVAKK